ncbi:MAG: TetR/AcrR family transcriptional regulator [Ktedonobacteraceae bacterium]
MQKGDRRETILGAALELIAERGFRQTPMSLIAKQAGASAGIIYHYFASKDELILELYRRVKGDLTRAVLVADMRAAPFAQRFPLLWLSMFHYCTSHPYETAFLEQYESSAEWQASDLAFFEEQTDLMHVLEDMQAQGVIKELPIAVITELTIGVALRLARLTSAGQLTLDDEVLDRIARACWDAIAN